jgi:hypothetical protein
MQLCSYAVMQLCSYAVMQLCGCAVMQLCRSETETPTVESGRLCSCATCRTGKLAEHNFLDKFV